MDTEKVPAVPANINAELELRKQQDEHQFQLATQQITANQIDRREAREHFGKYQDKSNKRAFIVCLVFIVLFFCFGAFALWLGKETLLSDLLKVLVGAFGGGGIGYIMGSRQKNNDPK